MSDFTLNKEPDLVVTARFIEKGDDAPLYGDDLTVRLYDRDIADDDFLGESRLDTDGHIRIAFAHDAFVNDAAFNEARPDFYFMIMKNGKPVYTTKVLEELSIEDLQQFRMGEGDVVDLGSFLVDVKQ
ncbi:hypothetical protein [Lacibacter sediminis]|uniref:Uncharacterized protein n=1 Tax=Lacibacter sediminis TaxID=2760713 RepID=A0A7G5XAX4_9BACT|nr:hypothetical protein [Lacibacter sediminis]QNA42627.1 hypothetical protein H4075_10955 [Lacibacter sediminis]